MTHRSSAALAAVDLDSHDRAPPRHAPPARAGRAAPLPPDRPACRLCGDRLTRSMVDFGALPLACRTRARGESLPAHDLRVLICDSCLLVQVRDPVPGDALAGPRHRPDPAAGLDQDQRFATAARQRLGLGPASLVIEVGSGDGAALRPFQDAGVPVLGIEPAADVAATAVAQGIPTEAGLFNAATAMGTAVRFGRADLVLVRNVLPAVPDLFDFAAGFAGILRPKGIVVFQFPHLLPIIQKIQFDAFRHDRYNYLSLVVLEHVLRSVGLRAFDAERLADHGGSLRVYACHPRGPHAVRPALKAARQAEGWAGLDRPAGYQGFAARMAAAREDVRDFMRIRRAAGRRVAGYGVSARGTMMLNVCGVRSDQMAWVADPDPWQCGRALPGCGIPIVSPETLSDDRPDDLVILPWPRAAEIAASLLPLRQKGTQFWTFSPAIKRV